MATLEQIQAKMDKLKAQAEALAAKNAQAIVDKIRGLMLQHGLTTKDIEANAKTKRAAKTVGGKAADAANASKKSGGKVAAKYQDPKTGATWTGRGRAPAWIASAKDRSKFLIGSGASAVAVSNSAAAGKVKAKAIAKANVKGKGAVSASAVKKASTAGAAAAPKGQQKADKAPQYRDPKSGATWSGRGRAPLWIAGAKDRSKFLIDGAQAAAPVAKTNKPKAAVTKAAVTKAAVTKAAVTKAPATKAAATKAPVTKAAVTKAPATKASATEAAATKAPVTKAAVTKAPVVKKVSAVKKAVVEKSPAADEKIVAKKAVVSPAKPKAVKKAVAKNTAPDNAVAASSDASAAPVVSAELAA